MPPMTTYQPYKPKQQRGQSQFPPQQGMQVVNRRPFALTQSHPVSGPTATGPHQTATGTGSTWGQMDPWYQSMYLSSHYSTPPDTSGGGDGGSTGNANYDALKANINRQIAAAQSAALASKKDVLLGFGSRQLAMDVLKLGANDPFIQSISDNPDTGQSWLSKEAFNYRMNQGVTNENLNRGNLFYSGARGVALSNLARQHINNTYAETTAVQGQLRNLQNQLIQQILALQGQLIAGTTPTDPTSS